MISDGKTVHFILNGGNQCKRFAAGIDGDFSPVERNGSCAVFVVLNHTEKRNGKTGGFQYGPDRADMAFTAVKQNQIRQPAEAFGNILSLCVKLFLKTALNGFQRPSVFKNDHARHVFTAGKV